MKQSTLGSYIRSLRIQNRMTQAQLADRLGVTDKAVSKWERDYSYPDMALFPKLADTLGVTANDLLKECIDESRPSRLLEIFSMSHDIRTPLHIILGSANLAKLHMDDPELLQHYLEGIRISGEYLLKSIERLMEITCQDRQVPRNPVEGKKSETGEGGAGREAPDVRTVSGEMSGAGDVGYPSNVQELGEYLNNRAEARKNAMEGYDFSGKRILVAEDILMNREIAAEILRQTGAEVEFAEDGRFCVEMVELAPAGYYDLILMDILMPDMDGIEATRRIRRLEDPGKASIPIIAISANVYEKDRTEAFEAGMDDFAEKPIMIDRLFHTINKFLQQERKEET